MFRFEKPKYVLSGRALIPPKEFVSREVAVPEEVETVVKEPPLQREIFRSSKLIVSVLGAAAFVSNLFSYKPFEVRFVVLSLIGAAAGYFFFALSEQARRTSRR
jgi:hypothetical protein